MTKQRAVRAVEAALVKVRTAEDEVAGWADEVRLAAERRMGIGRDDERAWEDPAYATALDRYGEVRGALERIEEVLERLKAGSDRPPTRRSE